MLEIGLIVWYTRRKLPQINSVIAEYSICLSATSGFQQAVKNTLNIGSFSRSSLEVQI